MNTYNKLAHAVTEFDRKQKAHAADGKDTYNIRALPQYFGGVARAVKLIEGGMAEREAVVRCFRGRLLAACLRALGLPKPSHGESNWGWRS